MGEAHTCVIHATDNVSRDYYPKWRRKLPMISRNLEKPLKKQSTGERHKAHDCAKGICCLMPQYLPAKLQPFPPGRKEYPPPPTSPESPTYLQEPPLRAYRLVQKSLSSSFPIITVHKDAESHHRKQNSEALPPAKIAPWGFCRTLCS